MRVEKLWLPLLSLLLLSGLLVGQTQALPFYGARAAAMGGAYTAVSDDEASIYYNPAGMTVAGDYFACVPSFVMSSDDRMTEAIDRFVTLREEITDSAWGSQDALYSALDAAAAYLSKQNSKPAGITGYLSYGAGVMLGPLAVSWLGGGQGDGLFLGDADTGRLIPDFLLGDAALVHQFYTDGYLNQQQLMALWPSYPDPDGFLGDEVGNGVGLGDNHSEVRLSEYARQEFVVTYADFLWRRGRRNEFFVSAGVNVKYLVTQYYGHSYSLDDPETYHTGPAWVFNSLATQPVIGGTASADLGLLAGFTPYVRIGLLARDVIPAPIAWNEEVPGAPQRLQPLWRLGLASEVIPDMLMLACDIDLNEQPGMFSPQQDLSTGLRLTLPGGGFWLAGGVKLNLADKEQLPLYTVGTGFHVGGIRLDLAVGIGTIDTSGKANTYFSIGADIGFSL